MAPRLDWLEVESWGAYQSVQDTNNWQSECKYRARFTFRYTCDYVIHVDCEHQSGSRRSGSAEDGCVYVFLSLRLFSFPSLPLSRHTNQGKNARTERGDLEGRQEDVAGKRSRREVSPDSTDSARNAESLWHWNYKIVHLLLKTTMNASLVRIDK